MVTEIPADLLYHYTNSEGLLLWCMTRIPAIRIAFPVSASVNRWLSGIPSAAILFRILHAALASTLCPCSDRARIVGPHGICPLTPFALLLAPVDASKPHNVHWVNNAHALVCFSHTFSRHGVVQRESPGTARSTRRSGDGSLVAAHAAAHTPLECWQYRDTTRRQRAAATTPARIARPRDGFDKSLLCRRTDCERARRPRSSPGHRGGCRELGVYL